MTSTEMPTRYRVGTLEYTAAGLCLVFFWLLWGDFTFTLMETIAPNVINLKLGKDLSASNKAIAFIMGTIPSTMNFFVNPAVSFRSDRYRGRWGRRIPFLFWSTPFVTGALLLLAFSQEIGVWVHLHLIAKFGGVGQTAVIVGTIGVLMVLFQFVNMFICSVYYYLFNDVVPHEFLTRFMALFRIVGQLAGMLFSWFLLEYALSHFRFLMLSAAALYFFGFMMMCWRLKEGEYPAPPPLTGGRTGLWAQIQTYFRESFTHSFYWNYFGYSSCLQAANACAFVGAFFFLHLGISLKELGHVNAILAIPGLVLMWPLAWLSERLHPMRVLPWCILWFPLTSIAGFFVVHDLKSLIIYSAAALPIGAFFGAANAPLSMYIFPKERYGQFGSADAMARSIMTIICSVLAGFFMDFMKKLYHGDQEYYRWLYIWQTVFQIAACIFMWRLFFGWKKYGGKNYVAPAVGPASIGPTPADQPLPAPAQE